MSCVFNIGQSRHTADCGYYCAYVLKLYHDQTAGPFNFSHQDVISRRDQFKTARSMPTGNYFASVNTVVNFLSFIGLSGYHSSVYQDSFRQQRSVAHFTQRVNQLIQTPRYGIILLLQRPGTTAGHYISILNRNSSNWCCYDPMSPHQSGTIASSVIAQNFWNLTTHFISH